MTQATAATPMGAGGKGSNFAPVMFGVTVFASAALIFLVEPMIARLVLPSLGGSPMVWNTCMAFFQAALLIGYLYAHLLQKVSSLRTQVLIHALVLVGAALTLPLHISNLMGPPSSSQPGLWLAGVLALSIGAPFAALSATAPLAQAWYARVRAGHADASNPYVLYAASNLGSLIALLAYPMLVEPFATLKFQTLGWSAGYAAFVLLMGFTAYTASKSKNVAPLAAPAADDASGTISWKDRLLWIALAAAPSSLMLGVTTYITTDIASTPFLWVLPLALYLVTFILAFSSKPPIGPFYILVMQGAAVIAVAYLTGVNRSVPVLLLMFAHVLAFFFTALMCHTGLSDRRPHPSKLTEFYFLISIGGVIGGAFNAFIAPLIFDGVWEYPIVLVLVCFARPWGWSKLKLIEIVGMVAAFAVVASVYVIYRYVDDMPIFIQTLATSGNLRFAMIAAVVLIFLLRDRGLFYAAMVGALLVTSMTMEGQEDLIHRDRSFFGVLKVTRAMIPGFTNELHILAHGTTLHGAQAVEPELACTPRVYYAPNTPIGQVVAMQRAHHGGNVTVGAVGMGTGSMAGFNMVGDTTRFFEIDSNVIKMTTDPKYFTYIHGCAKGKVDWVLGDARLKMQDEPNDKYDLILVDAFSSDAVPAHLLTKQAMQLYLTKVKSDGVVIMHLSNRHLDLMSPVARTAFAAGGYPLEQRYQPPLDTIAYTDAAENVIIIGRNRAALAPYEADPRWLPAQPHKARVWTDDYTNIFGAMVDSLKGY